MRPLLFGLMLIANVGWAQANQVTLKYDDGTGVSGELLEFTDGNFRIQASVGLISIPAQDVSCIGDACPAGTELELRSAPVKLTSLDGSIILTGDVIEFADGDYVLATDIGEVRINADKVTCEGAGCVSSQEPVSRDVVLVNGNTIIEGELVRLEDKAYIINVAQLGEVRIDATSFQCRGEACP